MNGSPFARYVRRRWWFVAVQGLVVVLALTGVLAARRDTSYARTSHFVLHPRSGTSVTDARNAVDVSHQDGPLVQTVLRVLSSDEMRRRAASAAGITDASRYRTSTTVAPGSNFFDVVVTGPAPGPVQRLGNALSEIGPAFVERSYPGFAFDTLGGRDSTIRSFPPGASLLLLAFVLGAVAAVGELFVVFSRQRVPTPDAPEARDPSAPMAAVDRDNGDGNANGNGNGNGNGEAGPPPVPAKPGRARPARRRAPTSR